MRIKGKGFSSEEGGLFATTYTTSTREGIKHLQATWWSDIQESRLRVGRSNGPNPRP